MTLPSSPPDLVESDRRTGACRLPRPEEQPTVPLWPTAGKALGLSKNPTYEAAKRGEIVTLRYGRHIVVPTAWLRRTLRLDPEGAE